MVARQSMEMKVALDLVKFPLSGYFAAFATGVTKGALYRSADYKRIKAQREEDEGGATEEERLKVPQVTENPQAVADILEKVNSITNDGRGSSVCRSVIASLRRQDLADAIRIAAGGFDKVRQYENLAFVFDRTGLIEGELSTEWRFLNAK